MAQTRHATVHYRNGTADDVELLLDLDCEREVMTAQVAPFATPAGPVLDLTWRQYQDLLAGGAVLFGLYTSPAHGVYKLETRGVLS
jgi:hypothetical protein